MARAAPWLVIALVLAPSAMATHQGPNDLNSVDLNVLVYHPYPDENGDPWGFPARSVNGTSLDWMAATYGAFFFPTAVFDGVVRIEQTPSGEGGGAYQETHDTYGATLQQRLQQDTPVAIRIEGDLEQDELVANVTLASDIALTGPSLLLRIVYVEDDVLFNGGSGIVHHRFVVRDERVREVRVPPDGLQVEERFRLAEVVDRDNVGVVAVLQNFDESSTRFAWKEVIQSATWLARQQGPTIQFARGVLLELYSATWCTACVVSDAVVDQMANVHGVQSSRLHDAAFEYLRPGAWWKPLVAVLGAVTLLAWLGRRPPAEAGS